MRWIAGIVFAATLVACSDAAVTAPVRAHDVLLTLKAPGPCVSGLCDPGGNTVLALVQVVNHGTATAYIPTCGIAFALSAQQFVGSTWVNAGPAIQCAGSQTPAAIPPGDSVQTNWSFAPGRWRVTLAVSSAADLSDEALATSGSVLVP